MRRRALLAGGAALAAGLPSAARAAGLPSAPQAATADLLLVLAVDVSRSIDPDEARLQRDGYRNAMTDPAVVAAMTGGPAGAVAVAYVEWASYGFQDLVIPWTRIGSAADATAWSDRLGHSPRQSMSWTSLSGALRFSRGLLADCPFEAARRVVDVSGDGPNNNGPPAEVERDQLVAAGVTINGLPIINDHPNFGAAPSGPELVAYYRDSVIGGPDHFLISAQDFTAFGQAIRRKLVQEIAFRPGAAAVG